LSLFWNNKLRRIPKRLIFQGILLFSLRRIPCWKKDKERRENSMKKSPTLWTFTLVVGCLFTIPSFTGWRGLYAEAAVSNPPQQSSTCEENNPIIDLKAGVITNPGGIEIGAIKDFLLDLEAGRLAYVIGVFDQPEKLRNKVFVLPWEIVQLDAATNTFTLSGDKTFLESAPSFALNTWSTLPTSQWTVTVTAYWKKKLGQNLSATHASESALAKTSDLVGMTIKDVEGNDVGTIEELVIDPETRSIAYAVLSSTDTEKSNHTVFFALPWNMVQANPVQHTFVANVDESMFAKSHEISRENLTSTPLTEVLNHKGAQTQKP